MQYQDAAGVERFAVRLRHRKKEWIKEGFANITQARQWRASRMGRIAEGRLFPEREAALRAAGPGFSDYAETWLTTGTGRWKQSTSAGNRSIVKTHLVPRFGAQRLTAIDRAAVRGLASALTDKGLTSKTIHNVVVALSGIFTQAQEDGLVTGSPAGRPALLVRKTRTRDGIDVFTAAEERLILAAAKESVPAYYAFILFLFRTGCRVGEATALRPEDLDLRSRYVRVERSFSSSKNWGTSPKNGRKRQLDLAADLVPMLKAHLAIQTAEEALRGTAGAPWLFGTPTGTIIRSNNFRDRIWRPLLKKLGLRYRCVHATRHTFASRLIVKGANLVNVQRQFGHSSISVTVDTYTHWNESVTRGRVLDVDRLAEDEATDAGTFAGTSGGSRGEVVEFSGGEWGE